MSEEQEAARGPGRPSKYDPSMVPEVAKLCALGATDDEVADFLGVDRATFYRWRHQYADFCDAVKVGKEQADDRVEKALYRRAVEDGDVSAIKFWLTNRRSAGWREKQHVEHSLTDLYAEVMRLANGDDAAGRAGG